LDDNNIGPFLIPLMGIMIPITAIIGAFVFIIVKTLVKARVRELEIKERIAMIERGLVPAPEVDPRGFDRAISRIERRESRRGSGRHRRVGVTLIGVGFGLMLLIGVGGSSLAEGIGVGGFLVIMGVAYVINSFFEQQGGESHPPADYRPAAPSSQPGRDSGGSSPV
jgi:hypothetical protein